MAVELSAAEVQKVAFLARLKLSADEVADYTAKLGQILQYVEMLNEISTEDVEPMVHAVELRNVFRDDVVRPPLTREQALSNAPKTDGQFFLVPQILDAE